MSRVWQFVTRVQIALENEPRFNERAPYLYSTGRGSSVRVWATGIALLMM